VVFPKIALVIEEIDPSKKLFSDGWLFVLFEIYLFFALIFNMVIDIIVSPKDWTNTE